MRSRPIRQIDPGHFLLEGQHGEIFDLVEANVPAGAARLIVPLLLIVLGPARRRLARRQYPRDLAVLLRGRVSDPLDVALRRRSRAERHNLGDVPAEARRGLVDDLVIGAPAWLLQQGRSYGGDGLLPVTHHGRVRLRIDSDGLGDAKARPGCRLRRAIDILGIDRPERCRSR